MKKQRKTQRTFSTAFKQEKVELIEQGKLSVKNISPNHFTLSSYSGYFLTKVLTAEQAGTNFIFWDFA